MSEPFVSDRMTGTADCAFKRPGFLSMLGAVGEVAEVDVKVESMKQNKRTIVRRRTQQLVYLELGRENGGVMLNLSEEGCGFQAITPVKCGESRFGFQINGGRRIAGDAEVVWADESGVMGGLRFLNLPPEARKEIRSWLEETNAPMEYGYASAAAASAAAAGAAVGARSARTNVAPDPLPREAANVRIPPPQQEAPPPAAAWSSPRTAGYPVLEEPRYSSPFTEAIVPYPDYPQRKSAAVWRGIAVVATVVAVLALGIMYQKDVGTSLIWLGETMSGKTKASTVAPAEKPIASAPSALPTTGPETATAGDVTNKNPSAAAPDSTDPTAADMKAAEDLAKTAPSTRTQPSTGGNGPNAANVSDRSVSLLERQNAAAQKPEPNWSETDSVEALWGAVQAGSVSAEVSLAERFARGAGVNKNCDQAKVLMKAAADKGNREARLRLYELETSGCQ
jgi:PilZ domain